MPGYAELKAKGICVQCLKKRDRDGALCCACTAKRRIKLSQNREKARAQYRDHYAKNKEVMLQRSREKYSTDEAYRKKSRASSSATQWLKWGVKTPSGNDRDALRNLAHLCQEAQSCSACGSMFSNPKDRHMDHNHRTGYFRAFVCQRCNNKRREIDNAFDRVLLQIEAFGQGLAWVSRPE